MTKFKISIRTRKIFITGTIILIALFFLVKYLSNEKEIADLAIQKEFMLYKIQNFQIENSLQNDLIGSKINIDSLVYLSSNQTTQFSKKNKIIIAAGIGACQSCYKDALLYFKDLIETNDLSIEVALYLIISTNNVKHVKVLYQDLVDKIPILLDTEYTFSKKLKLPMDNSIVAALNGDNTCLFTYLIDSEDPGKNANKSQIILRLFSANKISD